MTLARSVDPVALTLPSDWGGGGKATHTLFIGTFFSFSHVNLKATIQFSLGILILTGAPQMLDHLAYVP
jgi:hypothetical protein